MLFKTNLLWLGLPASLISASPVRERLTKGDIEDLMKRDDKAITEAMINAVPGCDDDPSYATIDSRYQDGEGWDVADTCSNDKPLWIHKCWTDTFFVEWQYEYTEWENKGMDIDCATTSDCNRQAVELSQSCETNTVTWNNKGQIALQAKLDTFWKKLGGGAELQYAHEWGGNEAKTTCTSNSQSGRCTWNDQECHAFWAAKRNIRIHGYSRRSCTTGRNTRISYKRKDGKYTVGMLDFSIQIPDSIILGCGAKCGDTEYPDPPPSGDTKRYKMDDA